MPRFLRPVATFHGISDTFADHLARDSVNPGTDYLFAIARPAIVMPADGMVTQAKFSKLVGFWLGLDFDNGWGADLLHNAELLVTAGTHQRAGAIIAIGGGTGSVATGPHCHLSLRPHHAHHLENFGNVDPERHIGKPTGTTRPKGDDVTMFCKRKSSDDWFIGGESPGTSANLLRLHDPATAKLFVPRFGKPIVLSDATFDSWAERFLEPVKTTGPDVDVGPR
ncbi:MAG TPA: peptidoglycan DD-metalloendopeptidase family protein [Pseudolysinimonas sp.]